MPNRFVTPVRGLVDWEATEIYPSTVRLANRMAGQSRRRRVANARCIP